ncbi:MAG TPA: hypothetical protein VJH03_11160 [Blastocatellia bacterium]|nr:hypothetical protein [Blastocatellia bacterium]
MDAVEEACQLIIGLPLSDRLKAIARYYQTESLLTRGDYSAARHALERIVEEATPHYRARALQSIGATYTLSREADAALPFYLAAAKTARDVDAFIFAGSQKEMAIIRSFHGDHKQALTDLERLFPLVRALARLYPAFYYDYLNSLAVELGEVGRVTEAQSALSIALASPFAPAFPEWSETRDELEARRTSPTHSMVAVEHLPEPARSAKPHSRRNHHRNVIRNVEPQSHWLVRARHSLTKEATHPAAIGTVAIHIATRLILDCLGESVRSRAPPAFR